VPNTLLATVALCCVLLLQGCSSLPDLDARVQRASDVAGGQGWRSQVVRTSTFTLQAWVPDKPATGDMLTVYVEGDGLSWFNSSTPSDDPTPTQPMVLAMAVAQPMGDAVYLARPCQYTLKADARCESAYWTDMRFSGEVVDAMDQAIDALKRQRHAQSVVLVGYSGGGAVTALLAERRQDVAAWITVAGNIDVQAWARLHRVTPLAGSLDPMAGISRLRDLPQWHFVGSDDTVVPPALVKGFAGQMRHAQVIERAGYSHGCCWARDWGAMYPALK